MKSPLSPQDYELLSAFLDGELKGTAGRDFQARLEKDPNLRAAWEELRNMRAVIRRMPKQSAPRSFTLTPTMVKARKPAFFALAALRTMQFSAALSGILLVLVLAGDLFFNRLAARPAFAPAPSGAVVEMALPPADEAHMNRQAADTQTTPSLATPSAAPAEEYALDKSIAPAAPAPVAATAPAKAPLATSAPGALKALPTEEMQAFEAQPSGGAAPQVARPAPVSETPPILEGEATAKPLPPTLQVEASPSSPALPETARPEKPSALPSFLIVEILLVIVFVVSIILVIFIRRTILRR